jgi:signal transduction histidine kinase
MMKQTTIKFVLGAAGFLLVAFFLVRAQEKKMVTVQEPDFPTEVVATQEVAQGLQFDVNKKAEHVMALLKKAADYFNGHTLVETCKVISHNREFSEGDVYVFMIDMEGRFLAHGHSPDIIWHDYLNYKDALGAPFVREMIQRAQQGGGWVTYEWRGATKTSYVQLVKKGEVSYIMGAGYYPHAKKDTVVTMVKGAVAVVNKDLAEDRPVEQAFSTISYRLGRFVLGDLYLYAVRFDGLQVAHMNQELIGQNALEYKDANGLYVNKEIIEKLKKKEAGEGVWVEYQSNNARKLAYAEKIVDKQGQEYFIACGYYPDSTRDAVVDLVRKGYQYLKSHGLTQAVKEFTTPRTNNFVFGDLYLFIYDSDGILRADQNESIIGQNRMNQTDEDGIHYVKEMLEKGRAGGGWVDFKFNKSFKSVYVEQVTLGADTYIIGSGLFPVSKSDTMQLLAKSAISYLQMNPLGKSLEQFVNRNPSFMRGDLMVFVLDVKGNCYAYGDRADLIWQNLIKVTDEKKKEYIRLMISATQSGPANITYFKHGREVVGYAERVEKEGLTLIVGSEFYM